MLLLRKEKRNQNKSLKKDRCQWCAVQMISMNSFLSLFLFTRTLRLLSPLQHLLWRCVVPREPQKWRKSRTKSNRKRQKPIWWLGFKSTSYIKIAAKTTKWTQAAGEKKKIQYAVVRHLHVCVNVCCLFYDYCRCKSCTWIWPSHSGQQRSMNMSTFNTCNTSCLSCYFFRSVFICLVLPMGFV